METRTPSEALQALADELVESEDALAHIRGSGVTIACLESDKEKASNRRTVYAECEKVPDKYRWAVPCDFTVTVYAPNVERFSDEQLRILMLHELMHVGVEADGNDERYFVVPHDVEDFRRIIDRYGLDWANGKA